MTTVDTAYGEVQVGDQPYWHLISTGDTGGLMLLNNIAVGRGLVPSVTDVIRRDPRLENAQTIYSAMRRSDEKERTFELIRQNEFPDRPSRMKTIYVFDDPGHAERAIHEWFRGQDRTAFECRLIGGSNYHRADAAWLDGDESSWEEAARNYWQGIMSPDPFPEVIVDGNLYFPGWQRFASRLQPGQKP